MPGVFISYRREDSAAYAGRLFDILSTEFGQENTFMDLTTIEGGDDFSVVIERKLDVSDALLAVIGTHWLTVTEPNGGRRLDNAGDFVRLEIGKALERGIRVIPVLVGGASLPHPNDLPSNLQALCERQAMEVRDSHFHADVKELTDVLHHTLQGTGFVSKAANLKRFVPVFLVGLAVVIGIFWLLVQRKGGRPNPVATGTEQSAQNSGSAPPPAHTVAGATGDSAKPLANVAGVWEATVKYDWGDTYHEWFDFEVDRQELSGTAGFLGVPKGQGRPIWEGKIDGDRISFMTKNLTSLGSDEKTYEDKHYYKGTVKGDEIVFTMVIDSSIESHAAIHFTANRVKNK
jgi:hypothetical protein